MFSKNLIPVVIIGIIVMAFTVYIYKSKKNSSSFLNSGKNNDSKPSSITNDKTLIIYAPWCGYCKKSMNEFLKASNNSNGKIVLLNSDEPGTAEVMKKVNCNGFPFIVSGYGSGKPRVYRGERKAESIIKFANNEE